MSWHRHDWFNAVELVAKAIAVILPTPAGKAIAMAAAYAAADQKDAAKAEHAEEQKTERESAQTPP